MVAIILKIIVFFISLFTIYLTATDIYWDIKFRRYKEIFPELLLMVVAIVLILLVISGGSLIPRGMIYEDYKI